MRDGGGDLVEGGRCLLQAGGLGLGALGQIVGSLGNLLGAGADARRGGDDAAQQFLQLLHGSVQVAAQRLVGTGQHGFDAERQVARRQTLQPQADRANNQRRCLGGRRQFGFAADLLVFDHAMLALGDLLLLHRPVAHGVVLEDLHGLGHGARSRRHGWCR